MSDPYSDPEDFGLVIVGSIDLSEPCYSFDMCVVWFSPRTGLYYWASDSGCSCPSPFEDYQSVDELDSGTRHDAINHLLAVKAKQDAEAREWDEQWRRYVSTGQGYSAGAIVDLVARISLGELEDTYRHIIPEEIL